MFFTSTVVGSCTCSRLISGSTSGTVVVLNIDGHVSYQFTVTPLQYLQVSMNHFHHLSEKCLVQSLKTVNLCTNSKTLIRSCQSKFSV